MYVCFPLWNSNQISTRFFLCFPIPLNCFPNHFHPHCHHHHHRQLFSYSFILQTTCRIKVLTLCTHRNNCTDTHVNSVRLAMMAVVYLSLTLLFQSSSHILAFSLHTFPTGSIRSYDNCLWNFLNLSGHNSSLLLIYKHTHSHTRALLI